MTLKLEDISFSYPCYDEKSTPEVLFNHLCLEIGEAESILILAPPGSGKTTLCSIIAGTAPLHTGGTLEGSITLCGKAKGAPHEDMDLLSLVPQDMAAYFITSACEDELASPLEALGVDEVLMPSLVDKALSSHGLEKYRGTDPQDLSGGEKRRLSLAVAGIVEPRIIVYDEAFDDLDKDWKLRLRDEIASRRHASIVTSCRFLPLFSSLFDSIYRLECGRLVPVSEAEAMEEGAFDFHPYDGHVDGSLEARDLAFSRGAFKLSVPSFSLKRGEVVSLTGPNGSGKSTFSRILCALEKASGDILLDGQVVAKVKELSRRVGYVFQNPDSQIFLPTVADEIGYALGWLGLSKEAARQRVEETAALYGLEPAESASMMSFGRRKKLQCAVYHCLDRPYYILDEIESALPYQEAADVVEKLASRGAGVLVISHDEHFSSHIASRHYVIEEGVLHEAL